VTPPLPNPSAATRASPVWARVITFLFYLNPYVAIFQRMDSTNLHDRLMEEARRHDPAAHGRSRLTPFRDVLLVWRAKAVSYEQIAATLSRNGLMTSPAGVGAFCRRNFSRAEILREQRRLQIETPKGPGAPAPSFGGLSAGAIPTPIPEPGRRGPKIARDNY
jgi:hypothetical protein